MGFLWAHVCQIEAISQEYQLLSITVITVYTFRYWFVDFQLFIGEPLRISSFFYGKITLQKIILKVYFKDCNNLLLFFFFFYKIEGTNNVFYSNCGQFWVFKIVKFEFKVIVHYGLWKKKEKENCMVLSLLKLLEKPHQELNKRVRGEAFSRPAM